MSQIEVITSMITREELKQHLLDGSLVKVVVDVSKNIMAVGGGLHADEEQVLLEQGSRQGDLWGINLYPDNTSDNWIEFDSMINLRPQQNNRSRGVENPETQEKIRMVVMQLVTS